MKIVPDCAIEAGMPSPNTRSAVDALLKLRGVALADVLLRVRAAVADLDNATNDAAIARIRSSGRIRRPPAALRLFVQAVREWTAAGGRHIDRLTMRTAPPPHLPLTAGWSAPARRSRRRARSGSRAA
ncbi:hypothetical protein [Burkholderia ambifaria]|uniref:hypothetical protein n=1 Tax=Burkholderia ambifaria TaxID=152480 RepID=UPI0015885B9E|nr:hypothetical protein [Burkholderia ambifaria]